MTDYILTDKFNADGLSAYRRSLAMRNFRDEILWLLDEIEEHGTPELPSLIYLGGSIGRAKYGIILGKDTIEIMWRAMDGTHESINANEYLDADALATLRAYRKRLVSTWENDQ